MFAVFERIGRVTAIRLVLITDTVNSQKKSHSKALNLLTQAFSQFTIVSLSEEGGGVDQQRAGMNVSQVGSLAFVVQVAVRV